MIFIVFIVTNDEFINVPEVNAIFGSPVSNQ